MRRAMLDESRCWVVRGVKSAEMFLPEVSLLLPEATHMFLEGSPASDIQALLASAADSVDYLAPSGTIWSWPQKERRYVVRASPELFLRLAAAASHHSEPEICSHVHFYRADEALLQWFDAFLGPMLVSRSVPGERVERFVSVLGASFSV